MLGFLIGTACLAGLIGMKRHERWHRGGWGHGCGGRGHYGRHHHGHWGGGRGGPWGGGGPWSGRERGFGERAAMRWLFEHLDTTHGQEKVIIEAVEELRGPARKAREEMMSTFGDLGDAVGGEAFDHAKTADTWVRQDKALEALRLSLTTSLAKIHEALDERQRKQLAELLARRGGAPDWA